MPIDSNHGIYRDSGAAICDSGMRENSQGHLVTYRLRYAKRRHAGLEFE